MIGFGHPIDSAFASDALSSPAGRVRSKKPDPPLKWWAIFIQSLRDKSDQA